VGGQFGEGWQELDDASGFYIVLVRGIVLLQFPRASSQNIIIPLLIRQQLLYAILPAFLPLHPHPMRYLLSLPPQNRRLPQLLNHRHHRLLPKPLPLPFRHRLTHPTRPTPNPLNIRLHLIRLHTTTHYIQTQSPLQY
jgi:hypothetical protein